MSLSLFTPDLEIDHGAVTSEAMRRAVEFRMDGTPWAFDVSLGQLMRRIRKIVELEADRDRNEALNRRRKLRLTLREAAILELSLQLEKAMHGLAMPYDQSEVDRISNILADLKAQASPYSAKNEVTA